MLQFGVEPTAPTPQSQTQDLREIPWCPMLVLCQSLTIPPHADGVSCKGMVYKLAVPQFPYVINNLIVVADFMHGRGVWAVAFRLLNPGGETIWNVPLPLTFGDSPMEVAQLYTQIRGATVEADGIYELQVVLGGRIIQRRSIRILIRTTKP